MTLNAFCRAHAESESMAHMPPPFCASRVAVKKSCFCNVGKELRQKIKKNLIKIKI